MTDNGVPVRSTTSTQTAEILSVVALGISTISVLSLLLSMLCSHKLRTNTFNLYLIFCFASDAFFFTSMLVINLVYLIAEDDEGGNSNHLVDLVKQQQQQQDEDGGDMDAKNTFSLHLWNEFYWLCASLWMSFIVFIQIFKLLVANKQTRRYQSPPLHRVIIESTIVHVSSVIMATTGSAIVALRFHYMFMALLVAVLILGGVPMVLITSMCYGVWKNKLLPLKNTRYRALTLFFARLLASTYLMAILVAVKVSFLTWDVSQHFTLFILIMFKLAGFFQVCLALTSKDIRNAYVELMCCCKHRPERSSKRSMFSVSRLSTTALRESTSIALRESNKPEKVVAVEDEEESAAPPPPGDNIVQPSIRASGNEGEEITPCDESESNKNEVITQDITSKV